MQRPLLSDLPFSTTPPHAQPGEAGWTRPWWRGRWRSSPERSSGSSTRSR